MAWPWRRLRWSARCALRVAALSGVVKAPSGSWTGVTAGGVITGALLAVLITALMA